MTNISPLELQELSKKMKEVGVTQKEVAEESGLSERYVQYVFSGQRNSHKVIYTAKQLLAEKSTTEFSEAVRKHKSIMTVL